MAIGIEDKVHISAATWPAVATIAPGDLSRYAPIGLGLDPPMVMTPWDQPNDLFARGSFYGADARSGDPFHDAPVNDEAGGVLYFDDAVDAAQLHPALALIGVRSEEDGYFVYASESTDPPKDRYLAQIRIIVFNAMNLFGARPDPGDQLVLQPLTVGAAIDAFITAQRAIWGSGMSSQLRGTLGGDGDWAKESLAFGFMVENGSNGVYRLWSRPWLVTK